MLVPILAPDLIPRAAAAHSQEFALHCSLARPLVATFQVDLACCTSFLRLIKLMELKRVRMQANQCKNLPSSAIYTQMWAWKLCGCSSANDLSLKTFSGCLCAFWNPRVLWNCRQSWLGLLDCCLCLLFSSLRTRRKWGRNVVEENEVHEGPIGG